jgi:hypothetical protein
MTRKIAAIWLLSFVCLLLGGCATGPSYSSMQAKIPPVDSGKGRVFFYRTSARGVQKPFNARHLHRQPTCGGSR